MCVLHSKKPGLCTSQGVTRMGRGLLKNSSKPQRNLKNSSQIDRVAIVSIGVAATTLMLQATEIHALPETPYSLQSSIEYGITKRGTLRSCPTNINPNCVSTSSTNDTYGPAWRATESNPNQAARVLENSIKSMFDQEDSVALLRSETLEGGAVYLMFGFQTPWGPALDIAEFLIHPDERQSLSGDSVMGKSSQQHEERTDLTGGALVTYRGLAGNVR
ncbi:hypothetical protein CEUSTIGMA_g5134.t1 [Chlamydomonas eustigma]|uniref:Uncharacterized protein n=1 Tax=Chlamydomonas eustigma TaxID=1157962 RepID=A0A250X3Q5_9CHLO|nr:hypothetical protein CEUSTIGMA_g5134.t1 [Chlamydomonas eustigma]|eukprot:GAX77691.1 hypothetical protein CEUSTIGMA_g5134.t1 [Chlamydomonas eustigma]